MRKILGIALVMLLVGSVGLASAGSEHSGKIVTFDSEPVNESPPVGQPGPAP